MHPCHRTLPTVTCNHAQQAWRAAPTRAGQLTWITRTTWYGFAAKCDCQPASGAAYRGGHVLAADAGCVITLVVVVDGHAVCLQARMARGRRQVMAHVTWLAPVHGTWHMTCNSSWYMACGLQQ